MNCGAGRHRLGLAGEQVVEDGDLGAGVDESPDDARCRRSPAPPVTRIASAAEGAVRAHHRLTPVRSRSGRPEQPPPVRACRASSCSPRVRWYDDGHRVLDHAVAAADRPCTAGTARGRSSSSQDWSSRSAGPAQDGRPEDAEPVGRVGEAAPGEDAEHHRVDARARGRGRRSGRRPCRRASSASPGRSRRRPRPAPSNAVRSSAGSCWSSPERRARYGRPRSTPQRQPSRIAAPTPPRSSWRMTTRRAVRTGLVAGPVRGAVVDDDRLEPAVPGILSRTRPIFPASFRAGMITATIGSVVVGASTVSRIPPSTAVAEPCRSRCPAATTR